LKSDGINKKDGRKRYKCKECSRAFITKLSFEEKHKKIKRDVPCPRCGNHYLHDAGNNANGKRYHCIKCKLTFAEHPVTSVVRERYECPVCKSNETTLYGKDHKSKKQRFYCKKCQRSFLNNSAYIQVGRSSTQWNSIDEMFDFDIWDVRVLGLEATISNKRSILNFSNIKVEWLKQASKYWIKYRSAIDETSTLTHKLTSIKKFDTFIQEAYSNIFPNEINRELIVNYLVYLNTLRLRAITVNGHIGYLNQFLQQACRHGWLDVTKEVLIFSEDYLKKDKRLPKFIPDEVVKQIEDNLDILAPPVKCMVIILRETGMRLSLIHI
jgi:integrase/recombinase XerD